ncbi:carotenoid oxygenase [Glonium stellatum]|uniref:Carotenoid oxygenase n=1 Tax=Glonium stellatum TaxID=574774 RepID=A0A8E2FCD9_9PEZI|nr:carotenoid oxygenase [Glonium stellatum]
MSLHGRKGKRRDKHPYLSGNFAPVQKAYSATPCSYTGVIPDELLGGQYIRNGGNPVSNEDLGRDAHWFDGDGMLAGVVFTRPGADGGTVQPNFINQYILTDVYLSSLENPCLRTPILPSISTLVNPVSTLIEITLRIFRTILLVLLSHLPGSAYAIKRISVSNTGIIYHDGRALATCESGPPMRIQLPELDTVGWYNGNNAEGEAEIKHKESGFGGTGVMSFMKEWTTGHPKIDPESQEMLLFHSNFLPPYVHYSVIPPSHQHSSEKPILSKILNFPIPSVSGAKMMHDFGVSKGYTIIMDLPLSLDPFNLIKNKPVVSYDPSKPSRFGVFPRRDPSRIRWFETSACCIFHTANAWDAEDSQGNVDAVNLLACRLTSDSLVLSAGNVKAPPRIVQNIKDKRDPILFFSRYDYDKTASGDGMTYQGTLDPSYLDLEKLPSAENFPVLDVPQVNNQNILVPEAEEDQCRLYYYCFSLSSPATTITAQYALSAVPFEFPTINPACEMSSAHYVYGCSTSTASFGVALGRAVKIDALVKMNVHKLMQRSQGNPPKSIIGCVDQRNVDEIMMSSDPNDPIKCFKMPEGWYAQEARFVQRSNATCSHPSGPSAGDSEDDGFLLFYAFDESQLDKDGNCPETAISELWILEAKNFTDVLARVQLPQRVPYGLHGNWFSEGMIKNQRAVRNFRKAPEEKCQNQGVWSWIKRNMVKVLD